MADVYYSGIEWVGDIPNDWKVVPNKYVMRKVKTLCEKWSGEDVLSLTLNGVIVRDILNPVGKMPATFDGYQYVDAGDLIMCLFDIDVTPRCIGYSYNSGVTSPAYSRYKVNSGYDAKYYYYYYLMVDNTKELLHLAKNLRHSIGDEQFGLIKVPVPPLDYQKKIADYLDDRIAQIDEAINNNVTIIDDYKKLKQSIISSEILGEKSKRKKKVDLEWIDEIPDGWEVSRLKTNFTFDKGLPITKDNLVEEGVSVISYGQIHSKDNSGTSISDGLIRFVADSYLETNPQSLVNEYDFIIADTSEDLDGCGNAVYCDRKDTLFAGYHTIILRSKTKQPNKYLAYLFLTDAWRSQIRSRVSGIKLFSITLRILNECSLILPPVDEQEKIVKSLDSKCMEIDKIIRDKQKLIEELNATKKSLVYEVVTGKRRV